MISAVNQPLLEQLDLQQVELELVPVKLIADTCLREGELDEMWSFVQQGKRILIGSENKV